jgi:hypothetical protein
MVSQEVGRQPVPLREILGRTVGDGQIVDDRQPDWFPESRVHSRSPIDVEVHGTNANQATSIESTNVECSRSDRGSGVKLTVNTSGNYGSNTLGS